MLLWIAVAGGLVLFWGATVFVCSVINLVIAAKDTIESPLWAPGLSPVPSKAGGERPVGHPQRPAGHCFKLSPPAAPDTSPLTARPARTSQRPVQAAAFLRLLGDA